MGGNLKFEIVRYRNLLVVTIGAIGIQVALHAQSGAGSNAQTQLEDKVRKLSTTRDMELLVRHEVGAGRLSALAQVCMKVSQSKDGKYARYGLMRCWDFFETSLSFSHLRLKQGGRMPNGPDVYPVIYSLPQVLGTDAGAMAGYYWWVSRRGEPGLKPPIEKREQRTLIIDGKKQTVIFTTVVADPAKKERLDRLFGQLWKWDPNNPMVLEIAATRAEGDPESGYRLMKKALDAGGSILFPERALYRLRELALKKGDRSAANEFEQQLRAWLRQNESSAWAKLFSCEHPGFDW